jgi:cyanobactin maturation PatA/PatG family protease
VSTTVSDLAALSGLKELWAETVGDPEICIAVLDGPVDRGHPSLAQAQLHELDGLTPASTEHGASMRHGTHVASVIFGQHGGPVMGIAPRCRGLLAPIFRDDAAGGIAPCSQPDLARAIMRSVDAGAQIINISGGQSSASGTAHPLLDDAVRAAAAAGALIVAAAGNEGCECLDVPGAMPTVLAVGAANMDGLPLSFSNWGAAYRTQGVLALGENIPGAEPGGGIVSATGTSYATAIVSGVAGLLLSAQRQHGQRPDPLAVRAVILDSAYTCDPRLAADCRPFMVGRLDITGAHARSIAARDASQPVAAEGRSLPRVGELAPDFMVTDHTGRPVRLRDNRGRSVVLWFYPAAETPG